MRLIGRTNRAVFILLLLYSFVLTLIVLSFTVNKSNLKSRIKSVLRINTYHKDKNTIFVFNETGLNVKSECVPMKIFQKKIAKFTTICIYNITDDRLISKYLKQKGEWEGTILKPIGDILLEHPNLMFLDVGCNIGTYTLYANKLGNEVIAIDPLWSNLQLLSKSLHLLHQERNVKLLWNAISDRHENIRLFTRKGNVGATNVIHENETGSVAYTVKTITLDDLVDEFGLENKSVYMKIDVESFEYKVLLGGKNFFRRTTVCFVAMEFIFHRKKETGKQILDFLESFGLFPYHDPYFTKPLYGVDTKRFGINLFFARKEKSC